MKEYAQLRDQAKTAQGRERLVKWFCLYAELRPLQQTAYERSECTEHMVKIADALEAAHDQASVRKALQCSGSSTAK